MAKYECIRTCFHELKRWKVGQIMDTDLGWNPNDCFVKEGESKKSVKTGLISGPGDDPRPTKVLREELREHFGKELPMDATRKEIWNLYNIHKLQAESDKIAKSRKSAKASEDVATDTESTQKPAPKKQAFVIDKKISDYTPDDWEKTTKNDMAKMLSRYGIVVNPAKQKKTDLMMQLIKAEDVGPTQ